MRYVVDAIASATRLCQELRALRPGDDMLMRQVDETWRKLGKATDTLYQQRKGRDEE